MSECADYYGQHTQFPGTAACRCLPRAVVDEIQKDTTSVWISGANYSFGDGGVYGRHYGVGCFPHDVQLQPFCGPQWCSEVAGKCAPYWCSTSWCWVNATNCWGVTPPVASSYFANAPRGSELAYSYETCDSENNFDSFYASVTAPKPPPPAVPSPYAPPPAEPARTYDVEIGLSSGFGALLLVCIALGALLLIRKTRLLQWKQLQDARERAKAALETTHNINYTAAFVRASDFLALGCLTSHEALRDEGKLVYRDRFSDLALGDDYTVFLSHQWTSYTEPDPTNEQYPVMCAAIQHLAVEKLLRLQGGQAGTQGGEGEGGGGGGGVTSIEELLEGILVWVDYSSIPQVSPSTTKLAIQSLSAYSSLASAFVIVAPSVVHSNTGATCDFGTYRRRAWCRAEQLCHLFRNGMDDMYLAVSTTSIQRLHRVRASASGASGTAADDSAEAAKKSAEAEAQALFAAIDANADGAITADELREYLRTRGEDEATIEALVGTFGVGGGGGGGSGEAGGSASIRLSELRERLIRSKLDSMTESDWLGESIRVFAGDITKEMDKIALVLPILGLYAELYAVCAVDKAKEIDFAHGVLQLVQGARDEILPKTFTPAAAPTPPPLHAAGFSPGKSGGGAASGESMKRQRASSMWVRDVAVEGAVAAAKEGDFASPTLAYPSSKIIDLVEAPPEAAHSKVPPASERGDADNVPMPPPVASRHSFETSVNAAAEPRGARAARPIDLFGVLVETIEEMVDQNESLRKHLHREFCSRRGSMVARKLGLLSSHELQATKQRSGSGTHQGGGDVAEELQDANAEAFV